MGAEDVVDAMVEQWRRERPDLDPAPMALFGLLTRADSLAARRIAAGLAAVGLNRGEFDVLATLRRSGAPFQRSAGDLAGSMLLSPGAMTNRLDKLEAAGLISRAPAPQDRRSVIVGLTPEGHAAADRAADRHVANLAGMLEGLSQRQRDDLCRLLRRLVAALEDQGG